MGPEKIIEQIRRLRALATSSNEFEAAAAAAKAQELLLKYNLDLMDIPDEPAEREPIDAETISIKSGAKGSVYRWKVELLNNIAKYNFCRAYLLTNFSYNGYRKTVSGRSMIITGKAHNREVVFFLHNTLVATLERLAARFPKRNPPGTPPATWGPQKSFLFGAATAIAERLRDAYIEATRVTADSNSKALVLVDVTQKALSLYEREHLHVKKSEGLGDHDQPEFGAYLAGREAGAKIPLSKGVRSGQGEGRRAIQEG